MVRFLRCTAVATHCLTHSHIIFMFVLPYSKGLNCCLGPPNQLFVASLKTVVSRLVDSKLRYNNTSPHEVYSCHAALQIMCNTYHLYIVPCIVSCIVPCIVPSNGKHGQLPASIRVTLLEFHYSFRMFCTKLPFLMWLKSFVVYTLTIKFFIVNIRARSWELRRGRN